MGTRITIRLATIALLAASALGCLVAAPAAASVCDGGVPGSVETGYGLVGAHLLALPITEPNPGAVVPVVACAEVGPPEYRFAYAIDAELVVFPANPVAILTLDGCTGESCFPMLRPTGVFGNEDTLCYVVDGGESSCVARPAAKKAF